jgi:hypothetical protein
MVRVSFRWVGVVGLGGLLACSGGGGNPDAVGDVGEGGGSADAADAAPADGPPAPDVAAGETGSDTSGESPEEPPAHPGAPPVSARSGGTSCSSGRWLERSPSPRPATWPSARHSFGYAFDEARGLLFVDGGLPVSRSQQTQEWDGTAGRWADRSRPDGFGPRFSHIVVYDSARRLMIGWAGMARINGEPLPDGPWEWRPDAGQWKSRLVTATPEARGRTPAAAAFDRARAQLVMSGGYTHADLWTWQTDSGQWQQRETQAPQPTVSLTGHTLVYDNGRNRTLLIGNRDMGPDVWEWQPSGGYLRHPPTAAGGPLPREWMHVAYDQTRDRLMLLGGLASQDGSFRWMNDLWEWDPRTAAWTRCGSGPPTGNRQNGGLVHDPQRQLLVLFGGSNPDDGNPRNDLWEWFIP